MFYNSDTKIRNIKYKMLIQAPEREKGHMDKGLSLEELYNNILECDDEFNDFINAKCTQSISSNKTYINKEASGLIDEDELSIMREKICFVEGVRTGINLLLTIQNYSKIL